MHSRGSSGAVWSTSREKCPLISLKHLLTASWQVKKEIEVPSNESRDQSDHAVALGGLIGLNPGRLERA